MRWDNVKLVLALLVAFLVGTGVGSGASWAFLAARGNQVEVVEGYTTNVNEAGTGIGLAAEPDDLGKGYSVSGAFWREAGGPWHTSGPTCLRPLTSEQPVRMGVVAVEPRMEAPGREVVVWLECLD
jgi:hypothetical protein